MADTYVILHKQGGWDHCWDGKQYGRLRSGKQYTEADKAVVALPENGEGVLGETGNIECNHCGKPVQRGGVSTFSGTMHASCAKRSKSL